MASCPRCDRCEDWNPMFLFRRLESNGFFFHSKRCRLESNAWRGIFIIMVLDKMNFTPYKQHQHHQQRGNLLGCEGLCCRFRRSCVLICPLCGPRLRRCRALPLGSAFGLLSFGFFISSMFRPINAPLVTMFRDLFFLFIIIYWSFPPTYQFDV